MSCFDKMAFEMKTCTEIRGIKQASGCAIWKIIDFMVLWIIFPRTDCSVAFYPLTQSGISRRVQTALWKPRYTHQSIWLQTGTSQNEAEIPWLPSCLHEIILDMKITARACLVQHGRQEDMQQLQNRAAPQGNRYSVIPALLPLTPTNIWASNLPS